VVHLKNYMCFTKKPMQQKGLFYGFFFDTYSVIEARTELGVIK